MDHSTQPQDESMQLHVSEEIASNGENAEEEIPEERVAEDEPREAESAEALNPFLASLETITPEEIAPDAAEKTLSFNDRVYEAVRTLLMLICAGVFVFCPIWNMEPTFTPPACCAIPMPIKPIIAPFSFLAADFIASACAPTMAAPAILGLR